MAELVFLKLGGSLITDKRRQETARREVITRSAQEIAAALAATPGLRLLVGHGSGSFGHFAAHRYHVRQGNLEDWRGYAETAAAAQRLNRLVTDALLAAGVPAISVQPSASAEAHDGVLQTMAATPIRTLLDRGVVPLIYGDVALDDVRGCTIISTEQIMALLVAALRPRRIIMAGEVEGVYTADPQRTPTAERIPAIGPHNYAQVEALLTTAFGVDVTGGMLDKVRTLYGLVTQHRGLSARIISGRPPGAIERALRDPSAPLGTLISGDGAAASPAVGGR